MIRCLFITLLFVQASHYVNAQDGWAEAMEEWLTSEPKVKHYDIISFEWQGSKDIQPVSIQESSDRIEVTLKVVSPKDDFSVQLHAPDQPYAFFLLDDKGNEYKLTAEEGFGGFKPRKLSKGQALNFTVKFNGKLPEGVQYVHLIEGTCPKDCWNLINMKLAAKNTDE